jgi:hypothetical protein
MLPAGQSVLAETEGVVQDRRDMVVQPTRHEP